MLDVGERRWIGTVPPIDRLPVIADQADVGPAAANLLEDGELQRVQVLGLVDEQVAEPPPDHLGERLVALQVHEEIGQQVVEVGHTASALQRLVRRPHRLEPGLVECGAATGPPCRVAELPRLDQPGAGPIDVGHHPHRVASELGLGEHLADQARSIRCDHGCRGAGGERTIAEQPQGDRVERARLDGVAHIESAESSAQLAGGIAGEGERQHVACIGRAVGDATGDASGQHGGLARTCGGHDRERHRVRGDGFALLWIEATQQPARGIGRVVARLGATFHLTGHSVTIGLQSAP